MLIRVVVDRSILEMVLRQKLHPCPDSLPVRNDALADFWILVHLFSDQQKPTPLLLGMDFLKEHRCVVNYGVDLIQFPMQSDCWWPLFASSHGLYSMPLCVGASTTSTMTNCPTKNDCLEFPDGDVLPPDNVNVESETMPTDPSTVAQQ